jgi:GNAT superfamily N-acetyltransferase
MASSYSFIKANLFGVRRGRAFQQRVLGGLSLCSVRPGELEELERFLDSFAVAGKTTIARRLVWSGAGRFLTLLLRGEGHQIVGANLFYFRPEETEPTLVHESFLGIISDYRGRGLARALRQTAIDGFAQWPELTGITTEIGVGFEASRKLAIELGYQPRHPSGDPKHSSELVLRFGV